MTTIESLLDYNKQVLYEKIRSVKVIRNTYRANDLIDVLSSAPDRDKRIIADYEKDEVLIRRTQCKGVLRMTRFFTLKGVTRYLHEGKVFSYKNACSFFNVEPKDLEKEKLEKELSNYEEEDGTYNTKRLLRWLFEKRKSAKALGESCSIEKIIEFVNELPEEEKEMIPDTKLSLLQSNLSSLDRPSLPQQV
jgi:hypothetical protein